METVGTITGGEAAGTISSVETLPASFDEFCAAQYKRLLRLAYGLTGSAGVAEDLAQETMLRVCKHWKRVALLDHPDAWARRVLVNLAMSRGRRLTSEAKGLLRLRGDRHNVAPPSVEGVAVVDAIRKLPRRQAQAIALHYLDDMPLQDIAVVLECPENTVKTLVRRGRQALATMLREEDEELQ